MTTLARPVALTTLSEEEAMFRDAVREFAESEVAPRVAQMDAAHEIGAELISHLFQLGVMGIEIPECYGGAESSFFTATLVVEELSRVDPSVAVLVDVQNTLVANALLRWATPDQQSRWLPRLAAGTVGAYALSEAGSGSDAFALALRAVRDGDDWVLNGRKMWITAAKGADFGVIFARTKDGGGGAPPEITAFIVEPGFPGIEFNEIKVIRALSPYEIVLDNCEVPADNVLGEVGRGFGVAQTWLVDARIPYAAGCIGIAQEALDMACGWVKQRPTRDGMLADKQAVQWMIADSEVELKAARMLVYDAAAKVDAGEPGKVDASVCKLYGTETAGRVVDRAMQMFGGMGMAKEMPLERWYRELRVKRIGEGPSEVHRMVIARDKLRNTDGGCYFG